MFDSITPVFLTVSAIYYAFYIEILHKFVKKSQGTAWPIVFVHVAHFLVYAIDLRIQCEQLNISKTTVPWYACSHFVHAGSGEVCIISYLPECIEL